MASGGRWSAFAAVATTAALVVQLGVLANLLDPEEFALIALALLFLGLGQSLADGGLSDVIISRDIHDRRVVSDLFWVNAMATLAVGAILLASAEVVADFFSAPELGEMIRWLALAFLAIGPGAQFRVLLQRDLDFRAIAVADSLGGWAGAVVAIVASAVGAGPVAFVWGLVVTAVLRAAVMAVRAWQDWRPAVPPGVRRARPHVRYAAYRVGERFANFLHQDIDYAVIGRVLGPAALGPYALAYQIAVAPAKKLAPAMNQVAFPVLALSRDALPTMANHYMRLSGGMAMIAVVPLAAVAAVGTALVPTLFGSGWGETPSLLIPLALVGIFKVLDSSSGAIYLARDRAHIGFLQNLLFAIVLGTGLLVAAELGTVETVAWTYAGISALTLLVTRIVVARLTTMRLRAYGRAIAPAAIAGAAAAVTAAAVVVAGREVKAGDAVVSAVAVVASLAVAIPTAWATGREGVRDLLRLAAGR